LARYHSLHQEWLKGNTGLRETLRVPQPPSWQTFIGAPVLAAKAAVRRSMLVAMAVT